MLKFVGILGLDPCAFSHYRFRPSVRLGKIPTEWSVPAAPVKVPK
jgi:hypothetical protein